MAIKTNDGDWEGLLLSSLDRIKLDLLSRQSLILQRQSDVVVLIPRHYISSDWHLKATC